MLAPALLVGPCSAQNTSRPELLDALANAASTFARTAPGLGAREILNQQARVASIDILKGSDKNIKKIEVRLPGEFASHRIECEWSLTTTGALHEIRTVTLIDSEPPIGPEPVRHALTLGLGSKDDDDKKRVLETLEHGRLQGAAADFVPMLLLFTAARQADFDFAEAGFRKLDEEPMTLLRYRQVAGEDAFTEFRNRSAKHTAARGEVWFRQSDLLPVRITLNTEEALSVRYSLRNEAEVTYTPTQFGLAPATVVHRQYLNNDLLVENKFKYSDYTGRPALP